MTGGPSRPRTRARVRAAAAIAAAVAAALAAWAWTRSDPDRVFTEAQAEARAGRFDRAEIGLERLARLRLPTPVDRLLRAQVAGASDRIDDALDELRAIPDDHPLGPLARLSEGQLEARRGRLPAAEASFLRALERFPDAVQARRELVYIYSVQRRFDAMDVQLAALADRRMLDREHLLHWGRVRHVHWSAASDLHSLRRYLAADPDDRHSRLALAEALVRVSKPSEADAVLAALPADDPDAQAVRVRVAEALGDPDAVDVLLAAGPTDHPEFAYSRGQRALARGDIPGAVRHFRVAAAQRPHDRPILAGLAQALALGGNAIAARPLLDEVVLFDRVGGMLTEAEKDGADPSIARRLGLAIATLGRTAEARAWLQRAIAADPLDAEAQLALSRLGRGAATDPAAGPHSSPGHEGGGADRAWIGGAEAPGLVSPKP